MKIYLKLALLLHAVAEDLALKTKLFAVSPLSDINELFDEKHLESTSYPPQEETPETRKDVCRATIGSDLFSDTFNVSPIQEKKTNSNVPEEFCLFKNSSKNIKATTNSYTSHQVASADRTSFHDEFMFSCLACSHETEDVVEFFISREYRLNWLPKENSTKFTMNPLRRSRFVFERAEEQNTVAAIALVEEPASILPYDPNKIKDDISLDVSPAICNLTKNAKIRLCTVILKTYKEGRIKFFVPKDGKESLPCLKQKLIYRKWRTYTQGRGGFHTRLEYADIWAVGCETIHSSSRVREMYYISKGFTEPGHFLISRRDQVLNQCYI